MSHTQADEALDILHRIEPALARQTEYLGQIDLRLTKLETRMDVLLPTLATKAELAQLGYDLTWRFLGTITALLIAYLAAIWFVIRLTMTGHLP